MISWAIAGGHVAQAALFAEARQSVAQFGRDTLCPSCGVRRMAESATLLVDEVLPGQPMRQWVQASNLFAVIHYLQEQEGIHLEVKARKVA